ncbi:ead/Ea22-like family protein [Escherichia coli]
MSNIDIDTLALREAAEAIKIAATPQKLLAFRMKVTPQVVLALLDELERNQQYIKRRDQENEDIALTVGKLRVELEEAKSKLNEQREYYEGVIADGSKRIAELEKSEEQLINERDHAEYALADMYFAATGNRPEWSNCFSFSDAVDAVVDRIADLEAKQPSPVVPEEKPMPNPLSMYAVDAVAAIAEVRGWNACRAAMLHGAEPVSQTYKSQHTQFEQVADLYEMQFDDGRTCAFHTDAQKAAQWLQACDGNRVQEYVKLERLRNALSGNSPVTPDGWISCSERMPNEEDVLVYCSDTKEQMVGFHKGKGLFQFFYMNGVEGVCEPSHWMPLPEPPL